jgi:hypothetical protein
MIIQNSFFYEIDIFILLLFLGAAPNQKLYENSSKTVKGLLTFF